MLDDAYGPATYPRRRAVERDRVPVVDAGDAGFLVILPWTPRDPGLPEPSWELVRALIERPQQPAGRRETALWAVDQLERHLGPDWPRLAFENDPALRSLLAWSGPHLDAALFLVELALRLECLQRLPGFAKARKQLRTDVRYAFAGHAQLQLETAGFALLPGASVGLEVKSVQDGNPVDVSVTTGNSSIPVEVKVVHVDKRSRARNDESERLAGAHLQIRLRHKVSIQLTVDQLPDDLDAATAFIEGAAVASVLTGSVVERRQGGMAIVVFPTDRPDQSRYVGPPNGVDLWERLRDDLQEKAKKRYADRSAWLRFDVLNGLWQLTEWAGLPLEEKAAMAAEQVRLDLDGFEVAGVVLSSGCGRPQGPVEEDTWHEVGGGAVALRRCLSAGRARETIIVPLDARFVDEVDWWFDLYNEVEPIWLGAALREFGLPEI